MDLFYIVVIIVLTIGLIIINKERVQIKGSFQESELETERLKKDLEKTHQRYEKYANLNSTDLYLTEVQEEINKAKAQKADIEADLQKQIQDTQVKKDAIEQEIQNLKNEKQTLSNEIALLEEKSYLENFGFYQAKYAFEEPTQYEEALNKVREKQKKLILNNIAAKCHQEWTVAGSRAAGKKMETEKLQLMLRAFNGECDAAISKVKYNNVNTMENRINSSFSKINKLAKTVACEISQEYLDTKLQELYLVFEYQEKKQLEKEEQRRIKEQMREEERARREIEAELKKTEDEEARYNLALEKAKQELDDATEKQKAKLESKIQQLEEALASAELRRERAISRAQLTKSGHVYIISNVGSFGEDVFKIGMTRRLEPKDRVHELGDASVPFPFDIHGMIYSENAPELENILHRTFHENRVNQINERKEFFRVSIQDIVEAVKKISSKNESVKDIEVQFTLLAEAAEYRKSLAKMRAKTESKMGADLQHPNISMANTTSEPVFI